MFSFNRINVNTSWITDGFDSDDIKHLKRNKEKLSADYSEKVTKLIKLYFGYVEFNLKGLMGVNLVNFCDREFKLVEFETEQEFFFEKEKAFYKENYSNHPILSAIPIFPELLIQPLSADEQAYYISVNEGKKIDFEKLIFKTIDTQNHNRVQYILCSTVFAYISWCLLRKPLINILADNSLEILHITSDLFNSSVNEHVYKNERPERYREVRAYIPALNKHHVLKVPEFDNKLIKHRLVDVERIVDCINEIKGSEYSIKHGDAYLSRQRKNAPKAAAAKKRSKENLQKEVDDLIVTHSFDEKYKKGRLSKIQIAKKICGLINHHEREYKSSTIRTDYLKSLKR